MAENKTKLTNQSVEKFLNTVKDETKREDCFAVLHLMQQVTKAEPRMWGTSIVGFGSYHYVYATGHEGDAPLIGFSPRKQNLTLYIISGFTEQEALLKKLGKHSTGKYCLYIKHLSDVHLPILKKFVQLSFKHVKKTHPST